MPYTKEDLKEPGLTISAFKTAAPIAQCIKNKNNNPLDVIFVSYLFYKLCCEDGEQPESPLALKVKAKKQWERFMSGEIKLDPIILNTLKGGTIKSSFERAYGVYESIGCRPENYAMIVTYFDDFVNASIGDVAKEFSTPAEIVELAQMILEIKPGDRVADICCGYGNFLTKSTALEPKAKYFGYEINLMCAAVLAMKADVSGISPTIKLGDIEDTLGGNTVKFDKIFSNYPLGMRLDRYDEIARELPFRIGRHDSDWYFNYSVVRHLAKGGRAIVLTSAGSAWNASSREARKYFIDKGLVEAVINLPSGVMPTTATPLMMLILSHGNEKIKLVNAEDIEVKGVNYGRNISKEDVVRVFERLGDRSDKRVVIDKETAAAKNYSLAFRSYQSGLPKYKNGVKLGEVAEIRRGTIDAKKNAADTCTGQYLLQLADLEDGAIREELGCDRFVAIEGEDVGRKLEPYDLVISRSAQPVKMAVVAADEKRELYPSGNMFVVRVGEKVNPYYLLAFLMSDDGKEALEFAATGGVLRTISAGSLAELVFPLAEPRKQRKVAERMGRAMARYGMYLSRAEKARREVENVFYGEEE